MRTHRHRAARAAAAACALALAAGAAGCSGGGSGPDRGAAERASSAPRVLGAAAALTRSAELQAALTALLVERAHLVAALPDGGGPAAAALDDASVALADVLGASYSAARAPLLAALRDDDDALVATARALRSGDAAAVETASATTDDAVQQLARVLRRVVPALDAEEVASRLSGDVALQRATVRGEERWSALRDAAERARGTAGLIAGAVAQDRGMRSPATPARRLRADLTGLLVEHVALITGLAGEQAALGRAPTTDLTGARDALDANAAALAALLGDAYPSLQPPLLALLQEHLDRLDRYAAARAGGGAATAEAAAVRRAPAELARLLGEHVTGLPAATAQAELDPALQALLVAVDEAAVRTPAAASAQRTAVARALPAAALLASAVAEDLRLA